MCFSNILLLEIVGLELSEFIRIFCAFHKIQILKVGFSGILDVSGRMIFKWKSKNVKRVCGIYSSDSGYCPESGCCEGCKEPSCSKMDPSSTKSFQNGTVLLNFSFKRLLQNRFLMNNERLTISPVILQ